MIKALSNFFDFFIVDREDRNEYWLDKRPILAHTLELLLFVTIVLWFPVFVLTCYLRKD